MTTTAEQFPALQALLSHQSLIRAAQSSVKSLTEAIQVQENQSQKLREQDKAIATLKTQREDLLADIATGQDKTAELQALDTKLAQQNEATAQITQSAIVQTVAGLQRKLENANKELQALESRSNVFKRDMLKEQAEAIGVDYVAAANQLIALESQLRSLDNLLHDAGFVPWISSGCLEIPGFALDSVMQNAKTYRDGGLLTRPANWGRGTEWFDNLNQEKARLLALGVEI